MTASVPDESALASNPVEEPQHAAPETAADGFDYDKLAAALYQQQVKNGQYTSPQIGASPQDAAIADPISHAEKVSDPSAHDSITSPHTGLTLSYDTDASQVVSVTANGSHRVVAGDQALYETAVKLVYLLAL